MEKKEFPIQENKTHREKKFSHPGKYNPIGENVFPIQENKTHCEKKFSYPGK